MAKDLNNFSKEYLLDILAIYHRNNPHEKINEHPVIKRLKKSEKSFISRKNFIGHLTVSAIVLDNSLSKLLLVNHKILKKYIQPGGHISQNDKTFWQSAYRELKEETGIGDVFFLPVDDEMKNVPFDIDIHKIPENKSKQEPEHFHIDFRYLFIKDDNGCKNKINKEEVNDVVWVMIERFSQIDQSNNRLAQKIKKIISINRDKIFFNKIARVFSIDLKDINLVAVLHIVPDIVSFVNFIRKLVKKVIIIPKPNSISYKVLSNIPKDIIYFTSREELKKEKVLSDLFGDNQKYCIIDIGGYFATKEFVNFNNKTKKVIGIVEDTENGHQKYEKIIDNLSFPVISVARSELKQNEDDLVGYSVAFYTEWVIRKLRFLPRYINCGIIGYGKLGKGIAKYLFNQNIKPYVYDTDPIKVIEAIKDGCLPVSKKEILLSSKLLFCATGNLSLNTADFLKICPGSFVASVTSSDDEFNLNDINKYFKKTIEDEFIVKYENENTYFYLINNGNTVNFIDKEGDRVSDFIRLVQAEILYSLSKFTKKEINFLIHETTKDEKRKIASLFLDNYGFFLRENDELINHY